MLRNIVSNELFTILIIIGLASIAIAKSVAPKRFNDFIFVIRNPTYLKIYGRDQKLFNKFDFLLFINLTLSITVISVLFYQCFTNSHVISFYETGKLMLCIIVILTLKPALERFIGNVFKIKELTDQYLFQKATYKNYLGLILIPINTILIFTITPSLSIIYAILILLVIINLIGVANSYKKYQTIIKTNLFYFILYLCTLEIAPCIFLYKVFF